MGGHAHNKLSHAAVCTCGTFVGACVQGVDCPMCDAPGANRSLKSSGMPNIWTCHKCYARVGAWLKKGY